MLSAIRFLGVLLFVSQVAFAQGNKKDFDDLTKDLKSDILDDLEGNKLANDFDGLKASHLSNVETWEFVEPVGQKQPGIVYRWKGVRGGASPVTGMPISTLVQVPKEGEYRVFLRHWMGQKMSSPVTLSIEPVAGGKGESKRFGEVRLLDNVLGKEQEKKLPIKFESDVQLNTFPDAAMFAWEYWDVKLKPGSYRLSLQSDRKEAKVSAVFLSQSKSFRPSFSEVKKDNSLEGVWVRYRITPNAKLADAKTPVPTVGTGVTYHWRGRLAPGSTEPLWYDSLPTMKNVTMKEWSPFVDAREQVIPGGGPWSTWRPHLAGVKDGTLEVQFAWFPHEAAVAHTLRTKLGDGQAMFRVPHGRYGFRSPATEPAWGVWNPELLTGLIAEEELVERYFLWAEEAEKTLGLRPDHPKPKHLRVLSSCRTGVAHRERAAEMMAKLGVNWIPGAPAGVIDRFGLIDDAKANKIKMGDEIGTYTPADVINGDAALRAGFHEYLREQARLNGQSVGEFLGVDDPRVVESVDKLPENAGRFERRLFYCSQRYGHLATIPGYAREVRRLLRERPGAEIYNNYSPHPLFLTGRDMNESDWFLLPRAGAQTLGWAEDWATGGSWGLGTPMGECTTFYAALVDCSVRTRGYPAGFYVGSNCGYSAQKMFSCVSQGISLLHLYDWGPIDAWAEGSNAWSESQGEYLSILRGTHALGPADEIIAKGRREPRRTALLYNRSHEIVSGSQVWLNRDWMWTFLGLRNSQTPVDVIIEEDLNETDLKRYDLLFVGGLNLERRHARALRSWVEQGGWLVGSAGCGLNDVYGDRLSDTVDLFGASQQLADSQDKSSRDRVTFSESDCFAAGELAAFAAGEQKYVLTPTAAVVAGKYDGGQVAATINTLGKGRAILLGVTTGEMFRGNGGAKGLGRDWLATLAHRRLGRSQAEFDCPESEVTVFDHEAGTAVMLAIYSHKPADLSTAPGRLSVQTNREVREVVSGLHGPLKWERKAGRIEIETPPPAKLVVDTVILR